MALDTLVITSSPPSWAGLAAVTYPSHKAWADAHSYDYHADVSDLRENNASIAGFVKLDLFLHFLPKYKRVVWLDADLLVTNPLVALEDLTRGTVSDVVVPFDFNGHNATVIIADATRTAYDFFWACNNTGRKLFMAHDWKEMEAMRYFAMTPPYNRDFLGYVTAKKLCALHPGAYLPYVPERVTKRYEWEPGCFSIHLSALPLDRRIELAKEYAQKCNLALV